MNSALPESRALSGPDCLMLAMDRRMRKLNGTGNVCHLILDLEGQLSANHLSTRLQALEGCRWLARTHLAGRFPLQAPTWKVKAQPDIPIIVHEGPELSEILSTIDHHPDHATQLCFHLSPLENGTRLAMSWQHSLFDSRGAELLLATLGLPEQQELPPFWISPLPSERPFMEALKQSRLVKTYMDTLSADPLALLPPQAKTGHQVLHTLTFSAEETAHIDRLANQSGAMFMKSLYLLAVSGSAVHQLLRQRGISGDLLVPVPHDRRKKGKISAIAPNQLSFLFFRLPAEPIHDIPATVKELLSQLQTIMRSGILDAYDDFLRVARHLPVEIYSRLIYSTARGNMASFCFSDTGNVTSSLTDSFLGIPVGQVHHHPPNSSPPGLTIICYRVRACLRIGISCNTRYINEAEATQLAGHIRAATLGKAP